MGSVMLHMPSRRAIPTKEVQLPCHRCGLGVGHYHGLCRGCSIHLNGRERTEQMDEELNRRESDDA